MLRAILTFIGLTAVCGVKISYEGYRTFEVGPLKSLEDIAFLDALRDEADSSRKVLILPDGYSRTKPVDMLVAPDKWQEVQAALDGAGIAHSIVHENRQEYIDAVNTANKLALDAYARRRSEGKLSKPEAYLNYDDTVAWLEGIVAAYPDRATLVDGGTSYEGRILWILEINGDSSLPEVWLDGGIHSREWIAQATVLWIIEEILSATEGDALDMLENYKWSIMPIVNPDGYEVTWDNDRYWRKNTQPNDGSFCDGTDLNRNFDANFAQCGTSPNPCDDTYPGPSGFSAPETRAVADQLKARTDIFLVYSLHSYSQLWLVPWGGSESKPADYSDLKNSADAAAAAAQGVDGKAFTVGTPPDILYCAAGGTFDWAKDPNPDDMTGEDGAGIQYAYTPELRPATAAGGGFDIPPSNIDPSGAEIFAGIVATVNSISPTKK